MRYRIFILIAALFLAGCFSAIRPAKSISVSQTEIAKQEKKIEKTLDSLQSLESKEKAQSATLAYGVQYSLSQLTNAPVEVETAMSLNERIISILGAPNVEDAKKIKSIVDLLNSSIEKEKERGQSLLNKKDYIISSLQSEKESMQKQYDKQLWEMADKAKKVAKTSDENQGVLESMSGFFGLNAVLWGLKKFFVSALTWILVFLVIFIGLRVGSIFWPPIAALFSVFDVIGSTVISSFKILTPNALKISKLVPTAHFDKYKTPLVKIVDVIQSFKEKQELLPNKQYTLGNILDEFSRALDEADKNVIEEILKEQKWK